MTETTATYVCACCLEENEILVDLTAGTKQEFVEDCDVCCRPNVLRVSVDEESEEVSVEAEFEG